MATKTKTNKKSENKSEKRMSASDIRTKLKALTAQLKSLHEAGKIAGEKANDWLKFYYSKLGHTDLRTFDEWKQAGYSVKRGEHALHLWTSKKTFSKATEDGEVKFDGYGYCNLFSELQVEIRTKAKPEPEAEPEPADASAEPEPAAIPVTESDTIPLF